jgi:triosephosphate isomerase
MSLLIANWRPYRSVEEAGVFLQGLMSQSTLPAKQVYLALPYRYLSQAHEVKLPKGVLLGIEGMLGSAPGGFSESVAAELLDRSSIEFVLLGSRSGRPINNGTLNHQLKQALASNVTPVLCIGESLSQYAAEETEAALTTQLTERLIDIPAKELSSLIVVYEHPLSTFSRSTLTENELDGSLATCQQILTSIAGKTAAAKISVVAGVPPNLKDLKAYLKKGKGAGAYFHQAAIRIDTLHEWVGIPKPETVVEVQATDDPSDEKPKQPARKPKPQPNPLTGNKPTTKEEHAAEPTLEAETDKDPDAFDGWKPDPDEDPSIPFSSFTRDAFKTDDD